MDKLYKQNNNKCIILYIIKFERDLYSCLYWITTVFLISIMYN